MLQTILHYCSEKIRVRIACILFLTRNQQCSKRAETILYYYYHIKEHFKGTDHVGTFMGLKCVVYYANYRCGNQSSKIQVVP